jgi:hypothetical protein
MSEPTSYRPRCRNLTCKSMIVYGEAFESDPEYQMGVSDFWCLCTSRGIGPDDGDVSLDRCSGSDRDCYQE